jgi:hypothetical protein
LYPYFGVVPRATKIGLAYAVGAIGQNLYWKKKNEQEVDYDSRWLSPK